MEGIDPKDFEFVLSKIEDGFIFEKFTCSFLSGVLGYNFIPQGGVKDRGIDGLEHLYSREGYERHVYQFSIEKNLPHKLMRTLVKLTENNIDFDQLVFATNQLFPEKDKFIDEAFDKYKKPVHIWDASWFCSNINKSEATVNAYRVFVDSYLCEFNKPGKSYIVGDMVSDPRLFVFLRQQREANRQDLGLDKILADSLIIFSLENTDPDEGIVKTQAEILDSIKNYIKFDPVLLHKLIIKRLGVLSSNPRRIQCHKKLKGYCLPYETRLQIQKKNIEDIALHDKFKLSMESRLKTYLHGADLKVRDCVVLVEELINRIFYEQGMEFADFVLKGENQDAIEKKLPDLIATTVDNSSVINKNQEGVKTALLMMLRDVIYNGSVLEKDFLKRLSNTYMMLFLVQCDPKLTMYFSSMASNLNIYVCTSIIIPALSEFYLDSINRRHWNLLKGAHEAGVRLVINETILQELIGHFKRIIRIFDEEYKGSEDLYTNEKEILFIEEILIRAYFYARMRGKTSSFRDFLENFFNPDNIGSQSIEHDIIIFLKEEFGIEYFTDKSRDIHINPEEERQLFEKLKILKHSDHKAMVDVRIILAIYAFREKRNEKADRGIFGYKTWWLSKDVLTHKTLCGLLNKNIVSCYIRPDFLYNYISLAPRKPEVDEAFKNMFPTMVGVNISFHLPTEITDFVHKQIKEHRAKNPTRMKAILGDLAERLTMDPSYRTREKVGHYLDDKLRELN